LRAASAAALLITVLLVPATAGQAAATSAGRLLPNPGFESGLASWTADSGAASAVNSPVHNGSGALQIADNSATAGVSVRSSRLAVAPGERITAGIWVRPAAAGAGGSLYLEFWRADGTRTTPVNAGAAASSTAWQQLVVTGDVPDDAVTAAVLAYSSYADQGTTYWDDATVSALPPPLRKVPNAGFEEQRNPSTPTQWTVDGSGVSLARGSAAYEGDTAVKIADSTSASVSVLSKAIPATVGETITASAWADPLSGSGATLYLEFRDTTGARLSATTATPGAAGIGWQQVSATATAPAGTTTLTVRLYSLEAATGTTVWDDVRLRSSADVSYAPALGAGQQVLFAGDQRVESYTGVTHKVFPGSRANIDGSVLGAGSAAYNANPRCPCTVLPGGPGEPAWQMWFAGSVVNSKGTSGYATSPDGLTWTHLAQITGVDGVGGVVPNPAWTTGSSVPRYYGISDRRNPDQYYFVQSTDGLAWTQVPGSATLAGFDVETLTYDPIAKIFVAMIKRHLSIPLGPRTIWVSTSSDFKAWSTPRPSFAADGLDDELIPAAGRHGQTPWSEIYGMPAIRYGDQYLGTPWVFDIAYSPNRDAGDNSSDKGRSHIELATSRDLVNWSRPSRDDLIVPGGEPAWDYGFQLSGTDLVTVQQPDGQWVTRFYYGAFAGEHSCAMADVTNGDCDTMTGNSKVGMVSWPTDRFASFHGAGTVTTRPLTPAGHKLTVNYAPSGGSTLKVEVLDVDGNVITGYGSANGTPITTDAKAPGTQVTWGGATTLPSGQVRLRFTQTGGDLYAFTVS
jgi:hypothetical protein